ncbi:MAG: M20/M25/M40 family metallo-hydrolase [archaeon]|nr:MAG: M20/M25/M40 family metallo-hydrolase [archaeon]
MTLSKAAAVRLLLDSLKIYSPSSQEAELGVLLRQQMEDLGYSRVRNDTAGNVIGEIGRGRTKVLLCGHMDTVPGPLPVRRSGGFIRGRGAADAKSPLCALLLAGAMSADSGLRITFAGATREESDSLGVETLMQNGGKFDYAVFGEPGGASKITVGYRGRAALSLTVRTGGGHAGAPWAHPSAFGEFTSILGELKEYEAKKAVPNDHFRSLSITPTLVSAGRSHNVLPDSCEATLDMRVPPTMRASEAVRDVRAIVERHREGSTQSLTAGEVTEPYEAGASSTIVRSFQRAIISTLKAKPTLVRKTGTGDMNTFAPRSGAECLTYGPGESKTSHTDAEAVEVRDYLNSIEVLAEAFNQLGSLGSRGPR